MSKYKHLGHNIYLSIDICLYLLSSVFFVSCSTQRLVMQMAFPMIDGQYKSMQKEANLSFAAQQFLQS